MHVTIMSFESMHVVGNVLQFGATADSQQNAALWMVFRAQTLPIGQVTGEALIGIKSVNPPMRVNRSYEATYSCRHPPSRTLDHLLLSSAIYDCSRMDAVAS